MSKGQLQWEPATEAEVALFEALRRDDQESYFRALAGIELLLPVTADALAGRTPMGWGTWTADDRTHVLAFTSASAMRACLGDHAGSARSLAFSELATAWPNHEWWLAINPGLPVEGYLPPWFVTQLGRGDTRLPRSSSTEPRGRLERLEALERAKAAKSAGVNGSGGQHPAAVLGTRPSALAPAQPPARALPPVASPPAPPVPPMPPAAAGIDPLRDPLPVPPPKDPAPLPDTAPPAGRRAEPPASPESPAEPEFVPANSVEAQLLDAADAGNTDAYLSTLLLATVLLPRPESAGDAKPGQDGFAWYPEEDGAEKYVVCYTSEQCMPEPVRYVPIRFIRLISMWPDPSWSVSVNPGTAIGATLPGGQLLALASWAAEAGLGDDGSEAVAPAPRPERPKRVSPEVIVMQKAIAPSQVSYYLERGYDRVSGFVHRARELGHLRTPAQLRSGLGLTWQGSPFAEDADEIYVLRWSAYRPSLYRIPYGGRDDAAMRAMEGWVIEREPFRGNGFAPGDSEQIIAEFKVDSTRLPHGARLLRVAADGTEEIVAVLDADGPKWLRVSSDSSDKPRQPAGDTVSAGADSKGGS